MNLNFCEVTVHKNIKNVKKNNKRERKVGSFFPLGIFVKLLLHDNSNPVVLIKWEIKVNCLGIQKCAEKSKLVGRFHLM